MKKKNKTSVLTAELNYFATDCTRYIEMKELLSNIFMTNKEKLVKVSVNFDGRNHPVGISVPITAKHRFSPALGK